MIIDVPTLKGFLSVALTDNTNDALYTLVCSGVDAAIKNYCKLAIELQTQTEFLSGSNTPDLILRQRPIAIQLTTGTMTAGSAVVTGLSPAYSLPTTQGVGQAVSDITSATAAANVPLGTIIASIQSTTQITLSANATATGTYSLAIGPAIYSDTGGFGGQGPGAFATNTALTLGRDYMLDTGKTSLANYSTSGLIKRLGGAASGLQSGWAQQWGYGDMRSGGLTARAMPGWSNWYGNYKAVYVSGWGTGPSGGTTSTLPADLTMAAAMFAALMVRSIQSGSMMVQQQRDKVSTQFEQALAAGTAPQLGSLRSLLSRFREPAI